MKFSMVFSAVDKATKTMRKIMRAEQKFKRASEQGNTKGERAAKKYDRALRGLGKAGKSAFNLVAGAAQGALGAVKKVTSASVNLVKKGLRPIGKAARTAMQGVIFAGGVMTTALVGSANAAIDFESVMADVNKVVDFQSPAEFEQFSKDVLNLSTRIPVAAEGLAEIAAEAGAAGIALEDNLRFTEFVAKSAVAFDIVAKDAGDSFGKIRNVYELTQGGIEEMADAVNNLSNNMASKAPEVIDFINRAGGAAPMLKASAVEMAAFGSAMIATGTAPEVAARGMTTLATRLEVGSTKVKGALKDIGLSHEEMKAALKEDPGQALINLFKALEKSSNGTEALKNLVGQDFVDDFAKITARADLLEQSLRLVGESTAFAGSVQQEFETRAATTANSIDLLKNNLNALAVDVGEKALPAINNGLQAVMDFLQSAREETSRLQRLFEGLTAFWNDLFTAMAPWGDKIRESLDSVGAAFGDLGEVVGRIFGMLSSDGGEKSFGHVVGTILAGAFDLLLQSIEGVTKALTVVLGYVETFVGWMQSLSGWDELSAFPWDNVFSIEGLEAAWHNLKVAMKVLFAGIWDVLQEIEWVSLINLAGIKAAWRSVTEWFGSVAAGIWDLIPDMPNWLKDAFALFQNQPDLSIEEITRQSVVTGSAGPAELTNAQRATLKRLEAFREKRFGPIAMIEDPQSLKDAAEAAERLERSFPMLDKAARAVSDAVRVALAAIRDMLVKTDLSDHGVALMRTLAKGIERGTYLMEDAMRDAVQKVRDHLPNSPAKVGPLSDIHRLKFAETIAQSIRPEPMVAAIRAAAAATMVAASAVPSSAAQSVLPSAQEARSARVAGPSTGNGASSIIVNFGDTVINGASPSAAKDLREAAQDQRKELVRLLERMNADKKRTEF